MKTVTVRNLQKNVKKCVEQSQKDKVIITRHGKPSVLMIGVEGEDWEDIVLENDKSFWEMIHNRRKQSTISLKELRSRLNLNLQSGVSR